MEKTPVNMKSVIRYLGSEPKEVKTDIRWPLKSIRAMCNHPALKLRIEAKKKLGEDLSNNEIVRFYTHIMLLEDNPELEVQPKPKKADEKSLSKIQTNGEGNFYDTLQNNSSQEPY